METRRVTIVKPDKLHFGVSSNRGYITSFEQIFVEKPTLLPPLPSVYHRWFHLELRHRFTSNCYYNEFVNIYGACNGRSSSSKSRDNILHGASPPLQSLNILFLASSIFTVTPIKISIRYSVGSVTKRRPKRSIESGMRDKTIEIRTH